MIAHRKQGHQARHNLSFKSIIGSRSFGHNGLNWGPEFLSTQFQWLALYLFTPNFAILFLIQWFTAQGMRVWPQVSYSTSHTSWNAAHVWSVCIVYSCSLLTASSLPLHKTLVAIEFVGALLPSREKNNHTAPIRACKGECVESCTLKGDWPSSKQRWFRVFLRGSKQYTGLECYMWEEMDLVSLGRGW